MRGLTGMVLVIVSALCYSSLGILAKIAFAAGLDILSMLATRFTLGALALWLWILLVPSLRRAVVLLPGRRALGLLLWGIAGFAGQSTLFFCSLRLIPASLAQVLLYTCPAFLALILWARTGRRPSAARFAAIALALAGTFLCAGPLGGEVSGSGVGLAIFAGLWYATFLIGLHRLTPGTPAALSGALIISGAALAYDLVAVASGRYRAPAGAEAWTAIAGMVLTATVFGFALFVSGLKRVGPQVASILSTFEPLGTLVLAAVFLGERLLAPQWAGAAMIIGAGATLAATEEPEDLPATGEPAPLAEARGA